MIFRRLILTNSDHLGDQPAAATYLILVGLVITGLRFSSKTLTAIFRPGEVTAAENQYSYRRKIDLQKLCSIRLDFPGPITVARIL